MTSVDVSSGTAYAGRDANHAFGFRQFNASKHAQYFTPNWLAELLCEELQPLVPPRGPSDLAVLDPTCGSGRLLAPWKRIGATVLGIELDELAADHARFALGTTNVRTGDVLDYRNLVKGFSLVLTNPPYGLWWTPPDIGELWECETSGGKIESQGATLEICTRALSYNGVLVAIVPTSTFENKKDRALRDTLYANYKGILQVTLPDLFEAEYGIGVSVDLVVARRAHASEWRPYTMPIRAEEAADDLRYAFRRAFDSERNSLLPTADLSPVPVLSRLFNVTASHTVRVTPKGLKSAPDADGMLAFLDEVVTAFDPVRGIEHGIVSATLSPASILTLGPRAGVETLAWLGFEPAISEADQAKITRLQEKFRLLRTPLYPPQPHQRLAYLDDRSYPARATVLTAGEEPCFTAGRSYHLRPSWVRHKETAKVETVTQDDKDVTLITSVDRGYLAFAVMTDSGHRVFREIDAADVELLTTAFELPDVPDLEAIVPERITQHRANVARRSAFLSQKAIAKALREGDGTPNMGVISGALWKLRYAATCPVAIDYLDPALDVASWNKLDYVLNYVRRASERGEKTIVFSGLRVMVASMVKHLRANGVGVLPITAEVATKKRFGLIREFSNAPELNCIVASLNCLNRGYTITAANHVLIVDLEYSPEATDQAGDRVHRPGQTKDVYVQVLLSRDTIDPIMWEVVTQKAEAIRHAIDGKARFLDVAEILQKATGDVQLEIARRLERISLLPVPRPFLTLEAAPEPLAVNVVPFPASFPTIIDVPSEPLASVVHLPRVKPVQLALFGSML